MNWYTLGGALLHVLANLPQYADAVERLFDAVRAEDKAPTEVWQAVSQKIAEVKKA